MKKILSSLIFSVSVWFLAYGIETSTEQVPHPGTEAFYRQHPPVYHYGSSAPFWLDKTPIQIHVKDLITTERVIPHLPFSKGSPSLPFVGYLPSANELSLEVTAKKNGKQITFYQNFTNLLDIEHFLKFIILSQPDVFQEQQCSIEGEIKSIMITWWKHLFKTKEIPAYEIIIDDLKEINPSSELTPHEESLTVTANIPEVNQDIISKSSKDKSYPLVVYGPREKTVLFENEKVPAELIVTPLIDKNTTLIGETPPPPPTPTAELLGFVPNAENPTVSVKVDLPTGEVFFSGNLTVLAQKNGNENHLPATDSNGKKYQLQIFVAKDTLMPRQTTTPINYYNIKFGDILTTVINKEPPTISPNILESDKTTILESSKDDHKKYPLVVYGPREKTVSFGNEKVPAKLIVTSLIDKNITLTCRTPPPPPSTPTAELLGLVPNEGNSIVSVKVDSPVGEVLFYENLTTLTQGNEGENYLSAKDPDGKEYKLEVSAIKGSIKIDDAIPQIDCCHIDFGDKVSAVASVDNEGPADNLSKPVVVNIPNIISNLSPKEPVMDAIAHKIKKGGHVFVKPGFAHWAPSGGEQRGKRTVALSYFRTNTPINPKNAEEINSRIRGQYTGYEFLGIYGGAYYTTELIFMRDGKVGGRRVGLTTHTVYLPSIGWAYITPTEIEFNMTPGASNPIYEKVPAYVVSL